MSIVKPSENKDQFLLDRYRCCRANKPQVIWHYCKNDCAEHLRIDRIEHVKITDYAHVPNPGQIVHVSMEFKL